MARDIELVIDRLCLERPLLVGHSLGALVVMQYIQDCGTVLTYSSSSHSPHRQDPERFAADLATFAERIF